MNGATIARCRHQGRRELSGAGRSKRSTGTDAVFPHCAIWPNRPTAAGCYARLRGSLPSLIADHWISGGDIGRVMEHIDPTTFNYNASAMAMATPCGWRWRPAFTCRRRAHLFRRRLDAIITADREAVIRRLSKRSTARPPPFAAASRAIYGRWRRARYAIRAGGADRAAVEHIAHRTRLDARPRIAPVSNVAGDR